MIFRGHAFTDADWRQYRHAYYRLIEKVDAEIGRILAALQESGLAENTVVIFSSDHGDGLGAHRWNQKWALYEESVRVPFILKFGAHTSTGRVVTEPLVAASLDLFPTVCDFAGVTPPPNLLGRSLRPFIEGNPDTWRDYVVTETCFSDGLGTHGRMLRTPRYKYVVYSWGKHREQLFDLTTDPGETINLAVESRYAETDRKSVV